MTLNMNYGMINAMNRTNKILNSSVKQLTSQKRDLTKNPADIGIAAKMQSQIRGTSAGTQNIRHAQYVLNTADSAYQNATDILHEIKDITTQLQGGTLGTDEKTALEGNITNLLADLESLSGNVKYNGTSLLDGSFSNKTFMYDANGSSLSVSLGGIDETSLGLGSADPTDAAALSTLVDSAIDKISTSRATAGALSNRIDNIVSRNDNYLANMEEAYTSLTEVDVAKETLNYQNALALQQYQTTLFGQYLQQKGAILNLLV